LLAWPQVIILHSRGHVVPNLQHVHLAALRAFLQTMRDDLHGDQAAAPAGESPVRQAAGQPLQLGRVRRPRSKM